MYPHDYDTVYGM